MSTIPTIDVISDHKEECDNISSILNESAQYEFNCVADRNQYLESIVQKQPDLLLLCVTEIDGNDILTLCQKLKENYADLPIIVIAGTDTEEDRVNLYTAGVNDLIKKPYSPRLLQSRVKNCLVNQIKIKDLTQSNKDQQNIAQLALTQSAEIAALSRFVQHSLRCAEYEDLAELILETMADFAFDTSIMIIEQGLPTFYFKDDIEQPMERKVLKKLFDKGRIVEFSEKIVFNSSHASLLVHNFPLSDEGKSGRYKDLISILIEGIDARVAGIDAELELMNKQDLLNNIIKITSSKIKAINEQHKEHHTLNSQIMANLGSQIEDSFLHLGLEEEQEQFLTDLIQETADDTDALFQDGLAIDEEFNKILNRIITVLNEAKKHKFSAVQKDD